jgi:hypothetical protein
MKIGILLFEQFHGRFNIGSSRIRGWWLTKYWTEAEIFKIGQKYDVMIYQKVYWVEHAQNFRGIKILDLCDADFLHWGMRVKQMIDLCDAVTTSTQALAKFIIHYTDKPVWVIPDRLDFGDFGTLKKEHKGETKVAAWFGYSENFPMLQPALDSLLKNGIEELIVIADRRKPFILPNYLRDKMTLINYPWTLESIYSDLLKADIVLNPQSKKGRWKFKSNNKTLTAWALGLPVAHTEDELKTFKSAEARQIEGDKRYLEVREKYDIKKSVAEFQALIKELYENRASQNSGS